MNWATPADLCAQVRKLWDRGQLLAAMLDRDDTFPLRLALKRPTSTELSERFDSVRAWARDLQVSSKRGRGIGYRLVLREVRHRVIGANSVPEEVWIDTLDDALDLIDKRREAQRFESILTETRLRYPAILPWLAKYPMRALDLIDAWSRLLDVIAWAQTHPRPGIYLRQVDLPGIHSKFIEDHRDILSELLDCCLPAEAIDLSARGASLFTQRYGFLSKPIRVRLRVLDPRQALLTTGTDQDVTITGDTFARLSPSASRVFFTENEINFLAFPLMSDSLVIFGSGYGFNVLTAAGWLHQREIYYWGDIDTHGFAILDQLRAQFAHAQSFLMDRSTLLAHKNLWVDEQKPSKRALSRLNADEKSLYDDLLHDRLGRCVRLEQERVGFTWFETRLRLLRQL
jgi:hypothetical protein